MRWWVLWAVACGDSTSSETSETGTTPKTSDTETMPVPALVAWRAVTPGYVDATGGTVTLTAEVDGSSAAPPQLSWSLPTGESGDVGVEAAEDGYWTLSFDLPALADTHEPVPVSFSIADGGGEVWGTFEVHGRWDPVLTSFSAGWAAIPRAAPTGAASEVCDVFAAYGKDGTRWDVLVETQGCKAIATACPGDGGACQSAEADLCLETSTDLVCGEADHFRTASVETNFAVLLRGAAGGDLDEDAFYFITTFDESAETIVAHAPIAMSVSGIVLALNNTKQEPVAPALLAVSAPATGHFFDGAKTYEWTAIGAVTPGAVAAGTAWAGMFSASDLALGAGTTNWTWSVAAEAGKPWTLTVASPLPGSGTMSSVRTVTIDDPGFSPMAVVASGQDLDGDGAPELFVEAWGASGGGARWLVLDATDKSDTRPVRRLFGAPSSGFAFTTGEDLPNLRVARRTLAAGGGKVRSVGHHPSGDWDGIGTPTQIWLSGDQWDVAALLEGDAKEVDAEVVGMLGKPRPVRADLTAERGICLFGVCGVSVDAQPTRFIPAVIDGPTSGDALAPLAGDLTLAAPSLSGATYLRAGASIADAALSLGVFADAVGGLSTADFSVGLGSARVRLPDGGEVAVAGASTVSAAEGPNGERVYLISTPLPDGAGGVTHSYQVYAGGKVTELDFGEDPPVVAQILACYHPGTLVVLALVTADGGVEIGEVDLSGDGLSWSEGPLPLGTGVAPSTLSSLRHLNPSGTVRLRPWTPGDGRLVWSKSHDNRTGVFADGAPDADGDGFDDLITAGAAKHDAALLMVVPAPSACGLETWYLPPGDTLSEQVAAAEVVATANQPDCSDLLVPVLGLGAIRDAPDIGVLADASGALMAALPGSTGVLSTQIGLGGTYYWGFDATERRGIGGGDLVLTGSSTITIVSGSVSIGGQSNVWLEADGLGGFDPMGLDPAPFGNYVPPVGGLANRAVPSSNRQIDSLSSIIDTVVNVDDL